ncbi:MAG: type II toxin-antitoxin system RelE/ParE family toxin [Candidatus Delongbacteria bacterium]|nr:type II toxin-antitoxin system RelE/ParE family toxin [Candidatus Delongbacteria bacterium]MCG2760158.1 type II toxin-antitoxin system RelE/ParE family toxin [Candidatus Delongbacteria bacterium]
MYKVIVTDYALKELSKIDKENQQLIFNKIKDLESGIFTNDKPLKGKHKGKFRKRCGNFRIVYLKENDIFLITVIRVAHRKEVY